MKKKDVLTLLLWLSLAGTGVWIGGFWGGTMAGAFLLLALAFSIGKWQMHKAARRINRSIREIILDNNLNAPK